MPGEETRKEPDIDMSVIKQIRMSTYNYEDTRWAAYQNLEKDSVNVGHMQFLAVGSKNTFKKPPKNMPDSPHGLGWRYKFIGWVNLGTGNIDTKEQ